MALLVLVILGVSLGWFSSILSRDESVSDIVRQIGVGIVASVAAGVLINGGTVLGAISMLALGAGVAGSVAALVLYHALASRGGNAEA